MTAHDLAGWIVVAIIVSIGLAAILLAFDPCHKPDEDEFRASQ